MTWILQLVRDSIRDIVRHKLRSILALLGIVFGIAAVITILGIGEGAQRTVLKEMSVMGLRNIIAESVKPKDAGPKARRGYTRKDYGLTHRDLQQIDAALPEGSSTYIARILPETVSFGSKTFEPPIFAVPAAYYEIFNAEVEEGILHNHVHERDRMLVCVANREFADDLEVPGGVLGERIKIGLNYFQFIGVIDIPIHKGKPYVYVPLATADNYYSTSNFDRRESGAREFTKVEIGQIVAQVPTEALVPAGVSLIEATLKANHRKDDYKLTVPLQLLESKQKTQRVLNIVLVAIALISLIVGGIGIMNIMLANVSERMGEIGIRRAIGATQRDIVLQFLVESTTLTLLGGVLGCILGVLAVPFSAQFIGFEGAITPTAVIVSLLVSAIVGLGFGIFPALNAAKLDPGLVLTQY